MHSPTPFFPSWHAQLAPLGARVAQTTHRLRAYTLCQLEERFEACLPQTLFPKTADHTNSRDRLYTRWLTFWSMLWQGFNPKAPGREVVRQIQALFELHDGPSISEQDGAYCRAKARLPVSEFPKALTATAQAADRGALTLTLLQGRRWHHADLDGHPQKPRRLPGSAGPRAQFSNAAHRRAVFPAERRYLESGLGQSPRRGTAPL